MLRELPDDIRDVVVDSAVVHLFAITGRSSFGETLTVHL